MPKQPGGIAKFQRIQALKGVLTRWGPLKKPQIDEYVAAALDCAADEITRVLYRDLEELVSMGEIVDLRFTRAGQELEEYDPELHRSTVCMWALPGQGKGIPGAQRLKESQVRLLAPSRLAPGLEVCPANVTPDPHQIQLFFSLDPASHCIRLDLESLPAKFVIARAGEDLGDADLLEAAKSFGKRTAYLVLPLKSISKVKEGQPGHLCLSFESPGKMTLTDLKSKNGTFHTSLEPKQATEIHRKIVGRGDATVTHGANPLSRAGEAKLLTPGSEIELSLPQLVWASTSFALLVI